MVAVKQLVQESQREKKEDAPDERVKFTDYFAEFRREVWLMRYKNSCLYFWLSLSVACIIAMWFN